MGNPDNVDMVNERAQTYITSNLAAAPTDGIRISPTLYLLAGNVIKSYYDGADGSNKMESNYFANGQASATLLADGYKKMVQYMSLQLSLVGGKYASTSGASPRMELYYAAATSDEKDKIDLVKDRIVDFSAVPSSGEKHTFDEGTAYITPGTISSLKDTGVSKGLVVAGGDVGIDCDFEGLIISGGSATVKLGGTYKEVANTSMLVEILDWIKKDDTWKEFFYATKDKNKKEENVAECIGYENWTKN